MKNSKFLYILILVLCIALTGCGKKNMGTPVQLEKGAGDYVARISFKDYGTITFRLFEDSSKEAVESFVNKAQSGYYEGLSVGTLIEDYCLVIGDLESSSTASDSKVKINDNYYPYRGALCITDISDAVDASRFMIVNSDTEFLKNLEELLAYKKVTLSEYLDTAYGVKLNESELQSFYTYGGTPWLYGHALVFGQVYEGFEVLDAINRAVTLEDGSYKPEEDIIIESVEVVKQ